jgi:hypothetical protein
MKTLIALALLITTAFAQSNPVRTCYDDLLYPDGGNKTADNIGHVAGLFTSGLAIAGSPFAAIPATVMLTAYGISYVEQGKENRLMKLIEQAQDKVDNPGAKTGSLLKRTVRKINKRVDTPVSELDFAKLIKQANEDRTLCMGAEFMNIAKIKRQAKRSDDLAFLDRNDNFKNEFEDNGSEIGSEDSSVEN